MSVYSVYRPESISVTRIVTDDNDVELSSDRYTCSTLEQAIHTVRNLFNNDKMMFDCLKRKSDCCMASPDECVDDGYCYTMYIRKVMPGGRRITVGINNISNYAKEAFCFDKGNTVSLLGG